MLKQKITAILLACALALPIFGACAENGKPADSGSGEKVVIGSKDFTENKILAEMMAQIVEKNSEIPVERKLNMGGTFVCFEAIKKGQIDLYPEYTGTGLTAQLKLPVETDPDKVYDKVSEEFKKQFQIAWLKPIGFNNTYALAMPAALAEEKGIATTSDLAAHAGEFIFGADHEFFNREDGYSGLAETYGLKFKSTSKMNVALKYEAIGKGKMQVTDAYTTDGQLKAFNLTVLEDDKHFFPPYYAAPIVRSETLKQHPELEELLNRLAGQIDDSAMQELNYRVDNEKQTVEKVASDFLKEKGIVS